MIMRHFVKYINYIGLAVLFMLISASCTKEQSEEIYLICDAPSEILFNADGTSENSVVFIKSNTDWDVVISDNSWLTVSDKSGTSFMLKAEPNDSPAVPETVTLTITGKGAESILLKATQKSGEYDLSVTPALDKLQFTAEGKFVGEGGRLADDILFTVKTDLDEWTVALSAPDSWLQCVTDESRSCFILSASKNESSQKPEDINVSIMYGDDIIKTIVASQDVYDASVPMTDIRIQGVNDGTEFIITYANNMKEACILNEGKLATRGLPGDVTVIYSISSEATGEVLIGREQDEIVTLSFSESGELVYRTDSEGRCLVNTVAELAKINESEETLAGKYIQESDLNLLGYDYMVGQPDAQRLVWKTIGSAEEGWSGIDESDETIFRGEYDGNGFNIGNLYAEGESYMGVFGCIGKTAAISNVNMVSGKCVTEKHSGLLCGYNFGKISGCSNSCDYAAGNNSGGICGYNADSGVISDCRNTNTITGVYLIGGLCAENMGLITGCSNTGNIVVEGEERFAGGICGINRGKLYACNNSGDVINDATMAISLGGVCGGNYGQIDMCTNEGMVKGFASIGGIAGGTNGRSSGDQVAKISNCLNTAKIEGVMLGTSVSNPTGGIVGENLFSIIAGCRNDGEISGFIEAGGIAGYFYGGEIYSCYNTADVSCYHCAGGVVGYIATDPDPLTKLYSCYNTGRVSVAEGAYKGGVCAESYGEVVDCFYLGYQGVPGVEESREEFVTYVFGAENWPSSETPGWGTGDGSSENSYWNTLGQYVSGGDPDGVSSDFPRLWWEK